MDVVMGKRGPAPQSKLTVLDLPEVKRPVPPTGMTAAARKLFKQIVSENKANAFDTESVAMLRAFCEANNQHLIATKALQTEGAVITFPTKHGESSRRNPWFNVQKEAASTMTSVSTKLRNKGIKAEVKKPKSKRDGLMFKG